MEPTGTHGWRCATWREVCLCGGEGEGEGGGGEGGKGEVEVEGGGGGDGGARCGGLGLLAGEIDETKSEEQDLNDHDVDDGLHGGGGDGGFLVVVVVVVSAALLFGRGS